ncbi:MAG: class I tRNA ligase family protein [Pseudomonadota bacterium]
MQTSLPGRYALVAPPPTPNGDLHVGHLSGPYLGVDVLARYLKLRGHEVVTALGVDLNQTYVVTTAERLGCVPRELADSSHAEIQDTLRAAGIGFDIVGMPDAPYQAYVRGWFERMHAAGVFQYRRREVPFDPKRERFLFESYASGWCPVCIASTKGNVCEACGHGNDARELIGLHPSGGQPGDPLTAREVGEYVFDIEAWREPLVRHLRGTIPEIRPALRRLLDEMLVKRLPAFPITFPSSWGIPAPFPGSAGLVLNVWAEMVPGHYHWLNQASRQAGGADMVSGPQAPTRYCQFLGFDNSFFYVVAHLALALAARQHGLDALLPEAFITNEFLQLENYKFSTSQGHLIWGRDLLKEEDRDDVRFYLSWVNPEYNQSNFTRDDFRRVSQAKLREPLGRFIDALSRSGVAGAAPEASGAALAVQARFQSAYEPARPSLRIAAQTLTNSLDLGLRLLARGASPGQMRAFTQALAAGAAPIVPAVAGQLWDAAGERGPVRWPQQPASGAATTTEPPDGRQEREPRVKKKLHADHL